MRFGPDHPESPAGRAPRGQRLRRVAGAISTALWELLTWHPDVAAAAGGGDRAAARRALNHGALLTQEGLLNAAEAAYLEVIGSGEEDLAAMAAFNLGALRAAEDRFVQAVSAYHYAIDTGDEFVVPRAALNLGQLLERFGHRADAEIAYELAIEAGEGSIAADAVEHLDLLLGEGDRRRTVMELAMRAPTWCPGGTPRVRTGHMNRPRRRRSHS